jgi:hypothetical protein
VAYNAWLVHLLPSESSGYPGRGEHNWLAAG